MRVLTLSDPLPAHFDVQSQFFADPPAGRVVQMKRNCRAVSRMHGPTLHVRCGKIVFLSHSLVKLQSILYPWCSPNP